MGGGGRGGGGPKLVLLDRNNRNNQLYPAISRLKVCWVSAASYHNLLGLRPRVGYPLKKKYNPLPIPSKDCFTMVYELVHNKTYNKTCATSKDRSAYASAQCDQRLRWSHVPSRDKRAPLPILSCCWLHRSHCRFCRARAHLCYSHPLFSFRLFWTIICFVLSLNRIRLLSFGSGELCSVTVAFPGHLYI